MRKIAKAIIKPSVIEVPGSKSYTHRLFIAAALSDGQCTIRNALRSEDTELTLNALEQLGIRVDRQPDHIQITGGRGVLKAPAQPIYLGNSGTSMRLLLGVAALASGRSILTGSARMMERPVQDLVDSLNRIGVPTHCIHSNGCPPVEIAGGHVQGGVTPVNCEVSSQFLSALLLMAPYTRQGLEIEVTKGPVSKPYIDMTCAIMQRLGVIVARKADIHFNVPPRQCYRAGEYTVEPDCSQAGYFWAAAAVTGTAVKVKHITSKTYQGDLGLTDLFVKMGCTKREDTDGITIIGGPLTGITADMADMPDMVPTLAVVAAFAKGVTTIINVAHLRAKESDRIAATVTELKKMGVDVQATDDGMIITGGQPAGAVIETYNDHRIAMSFAVAGLRTSDVVIMNEMCVAKSFPNFWEVWERLYQ